MAEKLELEPCPLCGADAEVWVEFVPYFDGYGYDEKNLFHCGCKRCGLSAVCYWMKQPAIDEWNERWVTTNDGRKRIS